MAGLSIPHARDQPGARDPPARQLVRHVQRCSRPEFQARVLERAVLHLVRERYDDSDQVATARGTSSAGPTTTRRGPAQKIWSSRETDGSVQGMGSISPPTDGMTMSWADID